MLTYINTVTLDFEYKINLVLDTAKDKNYFQIHRFSTDAHLNLNTKYELSGHSVKW